MLLLLKMINQLKNDGTEQNKEIKDEKPEIKVKQEDNIEPKKETEVVGAKKIVQRKK